MEFGTEVSLAETDEPPLANSQLSSSLETLTEDTLASAHHLYIQDPTGLVPSEDFSFSGDAQENSPFRQLRRKRSKHVRFNSANLCDINFTFSPNEYDRTCLEPATADERACDMPARCPNESEWVCEASSPISNRSDGLSHFRGTENPYIRNKASSSEFLKDFYSEPYNDISPPPGLVTDCSSVESASSCDESDKHSNTVGPIDLVQLPNNTEFSPQVDESHIKSSPKSQIRRRSSGRLPRKLSMTNIADDLYYTSEFDEHFRNNQYSGVGDSSSDDSHSILAEDAQNDFSHSNGDLSISSSPYGIGSCGLGQYSRSEILADYDCLGGF